MEVRVNLFDLVQIANLAKMRQATGHRAGRFMVHGFPVRYLLHQHHLICYLIDELVR